MKGEFPALDAITVDVSCADLKAIAAFRETASVSDNANVHGHQLGDLNEQTIESIVNQYGEPVIEEPSAPLTEETFDEHALSAYSAGSLSTTNFTSSLLSRTMEALSALFAAEELVLDARRPGFGRVCCQLERALDWHRRD